MKTLSDFGFMFSFKDKNRSYKEKYEVDVNMVNLKDAAESYEPQTTKNISELDKVLVDEEILTRTYTKENGEWFDVLVIVRDGEDYRVPQSVLKQLKVQMKENKKLKMFKVSRSGTGLNTAYTVIPL